MCIGFTVYMELNFVNLSLKRYLSLDWSKKIQKSHLKVVCTKIIKLKTCVCTENSSQIKLLEIMQFISPLLYVSNSFIKLYILGAPEDLVNFPVVCMHWMCIYSASSADHFTHYHKFISLHNQILSSVYVSHIFISG